MMLPPQQGATRAQLLACDWRVGPALSVLAGMKERRLEAGCFRGFSWEHKSYFDRVLVRDFSHPHHSFSTKTCPTAHPTPSSRNKRQGHQVQGSCGLRLGMLPTPLGEILHPRQVYLSPCNAGSHKGKDAELYGIVPHTQSPFTREGIFQKNESRNFLKVKG